MSRSMLCRQCNGDGKCAECNGTGTNVHLNEDQPKCRNCEGSGKCPECDGTGFTLSGGGSILNLIIDKL